MVLSDEQMILHKKWRSQKGRNQWGLRTQELDLGSQLNIPPNGDFPMWISHKKSKAVSWVP